MIDNVVRQQVLIDEPETLNAFRLALSDESLRSAIEELRPRGLPEEVSTLRVLDAAIWMRFSQSTPVRQLRKSTNQ